MAQSLADTLQTVELADGVEIQLRVAGPVVRSLAYSIDFVLRAVIYIGIWILIMVADVPAVLSMEITLGLMLLFMFFMEWFYNVFFEVSARSASPGQRWMKLRVMSASGGPVTIAQSILRNFLRVVDFMPFCYLTGILCMLFTKRFQRLGDLVADTVVIYADEKLVKAPELKGLLMGLQRQAPPVLLDRAEQAALLQFLERYPRWTDERRLELADLVTPLTQSSGGPGLHRLLSMALWLQNGAEGGSSIPPPLDKKAHQARS